MDSVIKRLKSSVAIICFSFLFLNNLLGSSEIQYKKHNLILNYIELSTLECLHQQDLQNFLKLPIGVFSLVYLVFVFCFFLVANYHCLDFDFFFLSSFVFWAVFMFEKYSIRIFMQFYCFKSLKIISFSVF